MSAQHTPTPWSVHPVCILEYALKRGVPVGHPLSYEPGGFQIFTDDGRGNGLPLPEDDREANAAHIVLCVNAHDALVAALERAFMVFGRFGGNHVLHEQDPQGVTVRHEEIRAAWIDARAAISAATEQS